MGLAGHPPFVDLDKALERGYLPSAWMAAHERSYVTLDQALLLTMLMARDEVPRYPPVARRFLIRFIREAKPTLEQVKRVADGLDVLGTPEAGVQAIEARKALADLARQLRERR